ncbi:hypothetical protein J4Q44_G00194440 [Coregonus suidteri]|uniref:Uncharacterized protein n=1 Tax=Coregonus suidteri TaxID=861788 RepID=A0AAN8LFF2_9TELE
MILKVNIQSEEGTLKPVEESGIPLDTTLDPENLPKNEDPEMDTSLDNEVLAILSKDLQTPTACQSTRASSSDSSGELLESEQDSITREYCQQHRKPPEDSITLGADAGGQGQRHLHMKSAEIYNLLQRIQSQIT